MANPSSYENIERTVRSILDYGQTVVFDPSLLNSIGHLRQPSRLSQFIQHKRDLFDLAGVRIEDARILDAGCGQGITMIILSLLGAKEVHGIDIYRPAIDYARRVCRAINVPVQPQLGDVASMAYTNEYFDVVLSLEAISHYYHVDRFFRECNRVLKSAGTLIIADSNNGRNPWIRRRTYTIWEHFENGPSTDDCFGHHIGRSYREKRKDIIRETTPFLPEEQVEELAKRTSGFDRDAIVRACKLFVEGEVLPNSVWQRSICPLDPVKRMFAEQLFDPSELAVQLRTYGFEARAYAYLGGSRGDKLLRVANRMFQLLSPLTLFVSRGYRIVARKVCSV